MGPRCPAKEQGPAVELTHLGLIRHSSRDHPPWQARWPGSGRSDSVLGYSVQPPVGRRRDQLIVVRQFPEDLAAGGLLHFPFRKARYFLVAVQYQAQLITTDSVLQESANEPSAPQRDYVPCGRCCSVPAWTRTTSGPRNSLATDPALASADDRPVQQIHDAVFCSAWGSSAVPPGQEIVMRKAPSSSASTSWRVP